MCLTPENSVISGKAGRCGKSALTGSGGGGGTIRDVAAIGTAEGMRTFGSEYCPLRERKLRAGWEPAFP